MTAAAERRQIQLSPELLNRARLQLYSTLSKSLAINRPNLEQFFIQAWPIIEPATPLQNAWYIGYVAEHFEAVTLRQIKRLAVSIHPRSIKSSLGTIIWPCWDWVERAFERFMFVSYSQELATDHSLRRRRILESRWYQENWGSVFQIQPDQNRKNVFENTASGVMLATSAGGTATGKGANIIVFDDFINPQEAESETERKAKIDAYSNTFSNRLNDPMNDAMVILAQRTHHQDLTGHVLKEGGWTHVELPIVVEKERRVYSYPMSKREHVRDIGDILNPARHDQSTIAKQKRSSGSRAFSAQYMCQPSSDEGNMVKRTWWRFYREEPRQLFAAMQIKAQSWDFSFKETTDGSFVVGYVGGRRGADKFLFDEVRDRMDFSATCRAVQALSSQWPGCSFKFYEDRANGPAVKSYLQQKITGLIPVEPLGSKEARMSAATPDIEAGNVYLPYPYDEKGAVIPERQWVLDYIEEMAHFPEEPNDRGDATSQLIVKLNNVVLYNEDQDEDGGSIVTNGATGSNDFGEIDLSDVSEFNGGLDENF